MSSPNDDDDARDVKTSSDVDEETFQFVTTVAIARICGPLLAQIRADVSIFAYLSLAPWQRALFAMCDAYDSNAKRDEGTYDAFDLARDAMEGVKIAMVRGSPRQRARACACARALVNINAVRGTVRTLMEVSHVGNASVSAIGAASARVGGRDASDEDASAELVACALACAESSGSSANATDGESRRDIAFGVIQIVLVACASERAALVVRGEALMQCARTVFHLAMIGEDEGARSVAKTALTQIINATFKRAFDSGSFDSGYYSTTTTTPTGATILTAAATAEELLEKDRNADDVLLLLLTLCKIAAREGAVEQDAYLTHSKALALDIIRQLMDGPRAATWLEVFHAQLRQPLSVALMRNALLQVPRGTEAEASVGILVSIARMAYGSLVTRARATWKQEVAALYPIMALHPLQSEEASTAMRVAALRLVRRLASDSQVLVDIFVNYDCDLQAANLYERTVTALSRAAQVVDVLERDSVLTCLFSILRSLQSWHARGDGNGGDTLALGGDDRPGDGFDTFDTFDGFDGELRPSVSRKSSRDRSQSGGSNAPIGSVAAAAAAATVVMLEETSAVASEESATTPSQIAMPDSPASPEPTGSHFTVESESVRFQKAKQQKVSIEKAVEAFNAEPTYENLSSAAGGADAARMAKFLRKTGVRLSFAAIGEFLGAHDAESLAVMRAYVHTFDFESTHIDDALRAFLGGFKLPGEAQKIDRLIEAFAARYCACNPEAYPATDAAYILAFAIVMLNTDAHNPLTHAGMKMGENDFVNMVKAADATATLEDDVVASIYARVSANEIKMHGSDPAATSTSNAGSSSKSPSTLSQALNFAAPWRYRSTLKGASDETAELLRATKAMFTRTEERASDEAASALFVQASEPGLARPMLDAAGKCMLMALSSAFALAPDEAHAAMPLEGARAMLTLASSLQLPKLRDDICQFLVAAPGLGRASGVATQSKEALNTLLELAASESHLGGVQAWASVLEIVSRLEHLRVVVGAGVSFNGRQAMDVIRAPLLSQDIKDEKPTSARGAEEAMFGPAELAVTTWLASSGAEAIERVFASSTRLDSDEIIAYASAVASVSRAELWKEDGSPVIPGKIFALLRLTEVAATNMTRVRLVWSKLWTVVAEHLIEGVKHPDEKVVLHATDSLRQVANRLLLRAQATRVATQTDAMRPFIAAMRSAPTEKARDLVTSCIAQALQRFGDTLGAGWEPAIEVLELSAVDVVRLAANTFNISHESLTHAVLVAIARENKPVDDEEYLGLPFSCVERATRLIGTFASTVVEDAKPLECLKTIASACRRRLAATPKGEADAIWVKPSWAAAFGALGALCARDDRALVVLFDLLDSPDVDALSADAWEDVRVKAFDALLAVKLNAVRMTTLVIPRLTYLVGAHPGAYDALSPSVWVLLATVLRTSDPKVVPDVVKHIHEMVRIIVARGADDDVAAWESVCKVLRGGVAVDAMMMHLPNASDVVNRSMACVAACDELCRSKGVPQAARDALIAIIREVYASARRANDVNGGKLTRLEFAAGDALLVALSAANHGGHGRDARRECLLEHLTHCLTTSAETKQANDADVDDTLASNALFAARERLAARALAAAPLDDAECVRTLAPYAIAMLRTSRRAPANEALAAFFEANIARDALGLSRAA